MPTPPPLPANEPIRLPDARGHLLTLAQPAQRIVSLVPSLTRSVCDLGGFARLVGRSYHCVQPKGIINGVPTLGPVRGPNLEKLLALEPDLVLAGWEENRREDIEALERRGARVWVVHPATVEASCQLVSQLGEAVGAPNAGWAARQRIELELKSRRESLRACKRRTAIYLLWDQPLMAAGAGSYIDDYLATFGLVNIARELPGRYPVVERDWILERQPEIILLSTEPYLFTVHHQAAWLEDARLNAARAGAIRLVDGELLGWYGTRMDRGFALLADCLLGLRDE